MSWSPRKKPLSVQESSCMGMSYTVGTVPGKRILKGTGVFGTDVLRVIGHGSTLDPDTCTFLLVSRLVGGLLDHMSLLRKMSGTFLVGSILIGPGVAGLGIRLERTVRLPNCRHRRSSTWPKATSKRQELNSKALDISSSHRFVICHGQSPKKPRHRCSSEAWAADSRPARCHPGVQGYLRASAKSRAHGRRREDC